MTLLSMALVQDCSNSSALAMALLQSWTKPSIWYIFIVNLLSSGIVYIRDLNWVTMVHADVLAPNGARASAGTMLALFFKDANAY